MIKLSESEIYIMNEVWKKGSLTSLDILNKVKKDKKISEKTVRTLLSRLVKKKAIYVDGKNGKNLIYKPLLNKDEFLIEEQKNFIENIYQGDVRKFLKNLVEDNILEIDELKKYL